ncbi:MAG: hypothetical protein GOV01_02625 [Candidatus Altiarchaeota archaeon]|nr:hypothetical protein [Candidatus Altiarchaeota archaeon]
MDGLKRALELLDTIVSDTTVPKNIRDTCGAALTRLNNQTERVHIRIGAALSMLDELSQDPNLPFHTRTEVWEVASLLETASTSAEAKC